MESLFNMGSGCLKLKEDVKVLLCHIFANVKIPLTKDMVIFCLQNLKIANFFDLNDSFSELISKGLLIVNEDSKLSISDRGLEVYEDLKNSLSDSIKERSVNEILRYVRFIKNIQENDVKIEKTLTGYLVNCSVSGGSFDLMKISVFAPDIESALNMKRNFYENLNDIYANVLSKLMSDSSNLDSDNRQFVI